MSKNLFSVFKNGTKKINYIYLFFFGTLFVLTFPPFNFWLLLFPSLTFLFLKSYYANSNKDSFLVGWFFGLSFFIFSLHWIFNSFLIRGDIYIYLIPISLFLFSSFLALFIGLTTFLNYKFKTSIILNILFFSVFWTFSEILRGHLFTGFPWNLLAHTFSNFDSLIQISSIIGAYGLSFLIIYFVLSTGCLFLNLESKKKFIFFFTSFSIFLSIFFYGNNRLKISNSISETSYTVRIVQPNINQKDKLNFEKLEENYIKLVRLSLKNKMGSLNTSENLIILWPETALFNSNHLKNFSIFKLLG